MDRSVEMVHAAIKHARDVRVRRVRVAGMTIVHTGQLRRQRKYAQMLD
jgi:hypothetical protein